MPLVMVGAKASEALNSPPRPSDGPSAPGPRSPGDMPRGVSRRRSESSRVSGEGEGASKGSRAYQRPGNGQAKRRGETGKQGLGGAPKANRRSAGKELQGNVETKRCILI